MPGFTEHKALPGTRRVATFWVIAFGLLALFIFAKWTASYLIDLEWWREIGQVSTFLDMLAYTFVPGKIAILVAFLVLWFSHRHGARKAGHRLDESEWYLRFTVLATLILAIMVSVSTVDTWAVVRYFGGRHVPLTDFRDPVYGKPLAFYFFDLPFYDVLLRYVLTLSILAAGIHWLALNGWQIVNRLGGRREPGPIDISEFRNMDLAQTVFLRTMATIALLALAAQLWIDRYEMVWDDHGFMVGIDYISEHVRIPLQWAAILASLLGAVLVLGRRMRWARWLALVLVARYLIPGLVNTAYVKPNEISLQKPYIQRHIEATRAAYGIGQAARETQFPAQIGQSIDVEKHRPLLDNVRLWDWRPFHDTVTQIQSLRPYYAFPSTDVDRYTIDGAMHQVLLTPRELDIRQLPDARTRWINPHFIYTHGYGLVMAESNKITPDGLPVPLIQNAPLEVRNAGLKVARPELYYGELTHEPVFVRTAQPEFNYPAGADNVHSRYEGHGGFPVSSLPMRLLAALNEGEINILLTGYLTPESRMMIHRDVRERLEHLAEFLQWDEDPYLVLTNEGRLVWMVDGFTSSSRHPYSKLTDMGEWGQVNYVRNSVKATVDAYDGSIHLYVFAPDDPLILSWMSLFPKLFEPASAMPPELREHARYPETLFRIQAFVYRTFHMRDSEAFYNKEDLWDVARNRYGQESRPEEVKPTYVVATLPGEEKPEYLLLQPFTPRGKDNLIGVMAARCDGPHLGELVVLQLTKQSLIFGPMQIDARIDQDQNISKDLTLWNQQGSRVIRGQMLVLPVQDTFLYVEPIYIQASEARMPQLKKIVLSIGNSLIYTDTYEQALAALGSLRSGSTLEVTSKGGSTTPSAPSTPVQTVAAVSKGTPGAGGPAEQRVEQVRQHLLRYRELAGQGKWADAGRELDAIEAAVQK